MMKKDHIIRTRRMLLGLSLSDIANALGVERSTVSRWENGEIKKVSTKHIDALAKLLQTTSDHIMGLDNNSTYKPILGIVKAGYDYFAEENILGYEAVSAVDAKKGDYFLQVYGNSMSNARINDGDLVYVKQCTMVEHGQIAVALLDHSQATIKTIIKCNNGLILRAENDFYDDIFFSKEDIEQGRLQIMGKVLHTTIRFV